MSKSNRLAVLRELAIKRGMFIPMMLGVMSTERPEIMEELNDLRHVHSAPAFESTSDDSADQPMPETLAIMDLAI